MAKKLAISAMLAACLLLLSSSAWADNITINNASFGMFNPLTTACGAGCAYNYGPIPGWNASGGGSWQPGTSNFTALPDGSTTIAFTNGSSISQTLAGSSLNPNSVYTLTVFVGDRLDQLNGAYTLSLDTIWGGSTTTLCSFSGNASNITAGTFQSEGCNYTTGSSVLPGNLFLQFTSVSGQLDVADVSLTDPPTTGVPEPSSALCLGIGMFLLMGILRLAKKQEFRLKA